MRILGSIRIPVFAPYPAYLHILLRRIPLAIALREPLAVATSLHARNGFSFNRGLILWWIYNHHIASQICAEDFLVPYSDLLTLDDQSLQNLFGPFLETHSHQRPSRDQARNLISSLLKPEFNRSEHAINARSCSYHPLLLKICESAYTSIIHSSERLTCFQEHFNALPRVVLESTAFDKLVRKAEVLLQHRLHLIEAEMRDVYASLEHREQECSLLNNKLSDQTSVVGRSLLLLIFG